MALIFDGRKKKYLEHVLKKNGIEWTPKKGGLELKADECVIVDGNLCLYGQPTSRSYSHEFFRYMLSRAASLFSSYTYTESLADNEVEGHLAVSKETFAIHRGKHNGVYGVYFFVRATPRIKYSQFSKEFEVDKKPILLCREGGASFGKGGKGMMRISNTVLVEQTTGKRTKSGRILLPEDVVLDGKVRVFSRMCKNLDYGKKDFWERTIRESYEMIQEKFKSDDILLLGYEQFVRLYFKKGTTALYFIVPVAPVKLRDHKTSSPACERPNRAMI